VGDKEWPDAVTASTGVSRVWGRRAHTVADPRICFVISPIGAEGSAVTAAIKAAEVTPTDADNPITLAIDLHSMRTSGMELPRFGGR